MQNRIKLTNTAVEKLSFPTGAATRTGKPISHFIFWDTELRGLGVRLSANSKTKTYVLQHRVRGQKQERNISLGRHGDPVALTDGSLRRHAFGADDARTKALAHLAQLLNGVDPVAEAKRKREEEERRAAAEKAQSTTLRQVLEHYLTHHRTKHGPLRPATQKDMRRHCEKNLTDWLDKPVATITRDMCLVKFTEMSARAPQQANLCMVYLRALLNHAREMHATDDGQFPVLAVNPVSRLWKLKKPNPERPRKTRIPLPKVGACWNWLRKVATEARMETERTAADWLCFVLLTGTRRLESGSVRWKDCNFEAKTITLHGDVEGEGAFAGVKNHNSIVLPMSSVLEQILTARKSPPPLDEKIARRRRVQRSSEYVFASNGKKTPFITNAQATIEALSKIAGAHVHLHALRRTFEDIAQACKIDSDVRRMLLNHISGDVHAVHYANGESALATACESIAQWVVEQSKIAEAQASGANVVPFAARA
jgi:integrase